MNEINVTFAIVAFSIVLISFIVFTILMGEVINKNKEEHKKQTSKTK